MAYENMTLREMMEAMRKGEMAAEVQTPQSFDDDFFNSTFEDWQPNPINIDACISTTLSQLEPYRLTQQDLQTVREFLTFRIQTAQAPANHPEARRAYYNLLIRAEEKESIRRFAEVLCKALQIPNSSFFCFTEQSLISRHEENSKNTRRNPASPLIPSNTRLLLIDECQPTPQLNLDGGGAARDSSKKQIENYKALWNTVLTYIRNHPQTILLVGSDEDVYRSTLRPYIALSQRICSHHIMLPPQSQEDLLTECMTQLRNSSFTLSDDFQPRLEKYFRSTYATSELRGLDFVNDLIDRIYANHYCHPQDSHVLTADCIPEQDPMAHSVESVLGQLDSLVGLETVKTEFRNIYKLQIAGLTDPENMCYHMLFTGNPGTGKTTVARLAADLFFRMGVIKTNKLVVAKPCDLVSEWIGGTGSKAMEVIRRAYNGVLFIDEAYGIANMDRGRELLNVLLQEMENNADKLIVIFAGYVDEMRQLLKANPGLGSRIGQQIHFDDYTPEELAQIFLQMSKKDGFSLDPSARDELDDCISALMTKEFFGNAREIQNMLQDLKEIWSDDYYNAVTGQDAAAADVARVFMPHHFEKIMPPKKEVSINDLIGLDVLKNKLAVFKRQAMYQKHLKEKGFADLTDFSMHMIFTGNSGTGKTSVAKLIADDLYSIGMLKTNRLVVVGRKDLVSPYGDTAQKTADVIRKAVGGVLFVDEAYSLAGSRVSGNECIDVLLTAMEEHKADTVFVFAGYVDEMQEFLAMNPGIQSRIGYTFHFEDYSAEELTRMYAEKMHKTGFVVEDEAISQVRDIMEYFLDVKNFGNGRFVNHVIQQTISQRANRDFTENYRSITAEDIPSIKTLIETAPNNMHLYDPATVTDQERRRSAVHELGHAIVMVSADPNNAPESISIRNHAGSLGRVQLNISYGNQTEQQLLNFVATLLGGKNAEKLFFGNHDTGCASDYARAKRVAEDMIDKYGMTAFGEKAADILSAADKRSRELLTAHKAVIQTLSDMLLKEKELSGEAFMEAFHAHRGNG